MPAVRRPRVMTNNTTAGGPQALSQSRTQTKAVEERRRGRPRSYISTLLPLLLLATTASGLVLHGQTPHGDDLERMVLSASGGLAVLKVIHLVLAVGFTLVLLWHLVDKWRALVTFARRRSGKCLRSLLASVVLSGLLVASMFTGLGDNGPGDVEHHTVVSIALLLAYAWHGVRRMWWRRRATCEVALEV
jgi:hypothetical protein